MAAVVAFLHPVEQSTIITVGLAARGVERAAEQILGDQARRFTHHEQPRGAVRVPDHSAEELFGVFVTGHAGTSVFCGPTSSGGGVGNSVPGLRQRWSV